MIDRPRHAAAISAALRRNPVVAVLGARQVGKTTLARAIASHTRGTTTIFDLERGQDVARLADPELALSALRGLVVIDEVQRRPDIFVALRVLADRPRNTTRFLVLGSAAPELLRQSAESLAGRISYYELPGFSIDEVGETALDRLWLRGSFPKSFMARSESESTAWRRDFIRTFLERDLAQLGSEVGAPTMERFWSMLAHWHGQIWNGSEIGRSFGVSHHAVRRYLDLLEATFMVRVLKPWAENIAKRQVKAPKIYVRDSGLLHSLLGVEQSVDLQRHPKLGASWEGFVLEALLQQLGARREQCFFWATHGGAELDLLVVDGTRRLGFEIKRTSQPAITPSMRTAVRDLGLTSLDLVHAGDETFPLAQSMRAVSAHRLLTDVRPLAGKARRTPIRGASGT